MELRLKVKSLKELQQLEGWHKEDGGYRCKDSGFINSYMLPYAGTVIEVNPYTSNINPYQYIDSDGWLWCKEWFEPLNPIWLKQKTKKNPKGNICVRLFTNLLKRSSI